MWDSDYRRFYPMAKRIDIYGSEHLFAEPPPKGLPEDFQFSSAYSHIPRCGLWPLYRGDKPGDRVSVKAIWVTPWSKVKQVAPNILNSLWGIVINEVDEAMNIGLKATYTDDDLAYMFGQYFQHAKRRRIWTDQGNSHCSSYNGVPLFVADGVMNDRYLGDWWITLPVSPYRKDMLSGWFNWLISKNKIAVFPYPRPGVEKSEKEWSVKFENRDFVKVKMEVKQYWKNKDYVYIGSGIWCLYEKTKEGEFLLGGPELSDDIFKSGYTRWAAEAVNKIKGRALK